MYIYWKQTCSFVDLEEPLEKAVLVTFPLNFLTLHLTLQRQFLHAVIIVVFFGM